MDRNVHILVSGRVQGVWFRGSTAKVAEALGLVGWVRNLPDGCVEIEAQGPVSKIEEFSPGAGLVRPELRSIASQSSNSRPLRTILLLRFAGRNRVRVGDRAVGIAMPFPGHNEAKCIPADLVCQ